LGFYIRGVPQRASLDSYNLPSTAGTHTLNPAPGWAVAWNLISLVARSSGWIGIAYNKPGIAHTTFYGVGLQQ
jgi:uncharacterized membrane protein YtjA (UPF0391 family)